MLVNGSYNRVSTFAGHDRHILYEARASTFSIIVSKLGHCFYVFLIELQSEAYHLFDGGSLLFRFYSIKVVGSFSNSCNDFLICFIIFL